MIFSKEILLENSKWEMATAGDGNEMWDGREKLHSEQQEETTDQVSKKTKCSRRFSTQNKFKKSLKKT